MKIGTIKGIKIKLHFSTLLIVALVGFYAISLYTELVSNSTIWDLIIVGLLNGIIILFSILIHELSHSIMAQRYGLKVSEIELYLFGGVSKIEEEPKTPKSEFVIAAVGPGSSLLLGVGLFSILFLRPLVMPAWLVVTLYYSGFTNVVLAIFNLLPAFPMDGGRILRAFLWKRKNNLIKATKTASKVGKFFGYLFMGLGIVQIFLFGQFGGVWMFLIGSFLNTSARKSYINTINQIILSTITVREVLGLSTKKFVIPAVIPLNDAIINYFQIFKQIYFPVVKEGGEIVGIIHPEDFKNIPIEQRSKFVVENVMKNILEFPYIYEEETGKEVIKKLIEKEQMPHIVIVKEKENQNIIGLIDEGELFNIIKSRELQILNS